MNIKQQNQISESDKTQVLMAKLSNLAYRNIRKFKNEQILFNEGDLSNWRFFQPENLSQDLRRKFFCAINNKTKEVAVVLRGSEPLPSFDLEGIVNDWWISDLNLVIGKLPKQFHEAYEYLETIKKLTPQDFKLFITGHSLGGSIVQLLCALEQNQQITAYTYNAYGVKHLWPVLTKEGFALSANFENINNFSVSADLVSNQNEHIGTVFVIKYDKNFIQTICCIISELPKVLTDIPFKIVKSVKYYLNAVKWFFMKVNGHLMNNFVNGFKYEEYDKGED